MAELIRFGVSMDGELLARFDELIREQGYANRSEAIRDLVRERLVRAEWEAGAEVVGVITLLYDHHKRELTDRLIELQHHHHDLVIATLHVHLNEANCLEILAVRGPGRRCSDWPTASAGSRGSSTGSSPPPRPAGNSADLTLPDRDYSQR